MVAIASFTSKADGNWSAEGQTTWNEAGHPVAGDTVSIGAHNITIDVASACATLSFSAAGTITGNSQTITINGATLDLSGGTISGNLDITISETIAAVKLNGSSGYVRTLTINGSGKTVTLGAAVQVTTLNVTVGTLNTSAASSFALTSTGVCTVGGGTLTLNASTVSFASGKTDGYGLVVNGGGTFNGGSATITSGAVQGGATNTWVATSGTWTVNGTTGAFCWAIAGSPTFTHSSGIIAFTYTGGNVTFNNNGLSYGTISITTATRTFTLGASFTCIAFTCVSGTLSGGGYTITASGTAWDSSAVTISGNLDVTLTNSVAAAKFNGVSGFVRTLITNGSGKTVTLAANVQVTTLTITLGTLSTSASNYAWIVTGTSSITGTFTTNASIVSITGLVTVNNGGVFNAPNSAGSLTIAGGITLNATSTFTKGTGTITISANQTITDSNASLQDFGTVTTSGTANVTLGSNAKITDFTLISGSTITGAGFYITVSTNVNIDGAISGNFDIIVTGTGNLDLLATSGNVRTFTLNSAGTATLTDSAQITTFTATAGTLAGGGYTLTLTGTACDLSGITISGNLDITTTGAVSALKLNGTSGYVRTYTLNCGANTTTLATSFQVTTFTAIGGILAGAGYTGTITGTSFDTSAITISGNLDITVTGAISALKLNGVSGYIRTFTLNSGANTVTLAASIQITTFTATTGTLAGAGYTATISGTTCDFSAITISGNFDVTLTNTVSAAKLDGDSGTIRTLIINGSSKTVTLADNLDIVTLTITLGTLDTSAVNSWEIVASGNASITGTLTGNGSDITAGSLTIQLGGVYSGPSGSTTITSVDGSGYAFNNLGTYTHNNGDITIIYVGANKVKSTGTGTLYALWLYSGSGTATTLDSAITVDDELYIEAGDSLNTSSSNYTVTCLRTTENYGTFTVNASTLNLGGAAIETYGFDSEGTFNGGSGTHNFSSLWIDGTFTFSSGVTTIYDEAFVATHVAINITNTPTISHANGTLTFTYAGEQYLRDQHNTDREFYNLIINKVSGSVRMISGQGFNITVSHNLTVSAGYLAVEDVLGVGFNLTVSGATSVTGTLGECRSTKIFSFVSLTLNAGGIYSMGSGTTTLSGSWTNSSGLTFSNRGGTVTFTGSGLHTVTGTNEFDTITSASSARVELTGASISTTITTANGTAIIFIAYAGTANAYRIYIGSTLNKSVITNDFGSSSNVDLKSGYLNINETASSNSFVIESGTTLNINASYTFTCCNVTSYGTFIINGTWKCGGVVTRPYILDVPDMLDINNFMDSSNVMENLV